MTEPEKNKKKEKVKNLIPLRKNVLLLVGMGYFMVLAVFIGIAWGCGTASEAFELVKSPLMALIGGSLALSKDLVDNILPDSLNNLNNDKPKSSNKNTDSGNN